MTRERVLAWALLVVSISAIAPACYQAMVSPEERVAASSSTGVAAFFRDWEGDVGAGSRLPFSIPGGAVAVIERWDEASEPVGFALSTEYRVDADGTVTFLVGGTWRVRVVVRGDVPTVWN